MTTHSFSDPLGEIVAGSLATQQSLLDSGGGCLAVRDCRIH